MTDKILDMLGNLSLPGFFVTAECTKEGDRFPVGLEAFVIAKLARINNGISGRKFVYADDGWRIILTFFPTNEVVDEKYALKNRI